jgi:hypothetical protein
MRLTPGQPVRLTTFFVGVSLQMHPLKTPKCMHPRFFHQSECCASALVWAFHGPLKP